MRSGFVRLVGIFAFGLCANLASARPADSVRAAGAAWARSLASGNSDAVVQHYAPRATLWGTFSPEVRASRPKIREYFTHLQQKPGLAVEFAPGGTVRFLGPHHAKRSGTYTFSYQSDGRTVKVPARYTFVYARNADKNGWKIVEHHSSVIPTP